MADRSKLLKVVTVLAVAGLIGLGLCGVSLVVWGVGGYYIDWLELPLALIVVLLFLGAVITLLAWVVWVVGSAIGRFLTNRHGAASQGGDSDKERHV